MIVLIYFLSLLIFFPLNGYAGPKEDYELQERCGKRASERFKAEFGNYASNDKDFNYLFNYTNHYNSKLNKCFMLVTTTMIPKNKKTDHMVIRDLYDVNENKEYRSSVINRNQWPECVRIRSHCET
jgi:hypothetical protein